MIEIGRGLFKRVLPGKRGPMHWYRVTMSDGVRRVIATGYGPAVAADRVVDACRDMKLDGKPLTIEKVEDLGPMGATRPTP